MNPGLLTKVLEIRERRFLTETVVVAGNAHNPFAILGKGSPYVSHIAGSPPAIELWPCEKVTREQNTHSIEWRDRRSETALETDQGSSQQQPKARADPDPYTSST
ncbi:MAG: hypothetical protein B6D36_13570 [Planctomycetes bacterium UTPLA1]|jgi:hypothetical protein|nr:MAG: hypothetical protein B6D36_13570 [Planctomycetes bacterium UTPLA1]